MCANVISGCSWHRARHDALGLPAIIGRGADLAEVGADLRFGEKARWDFHGSA